MYSASTMKLLQDFFCRCESKLVVYTRGAPCCYTMLVTGNTV